MTPQQLMRCCQGSNLQFLKCFFGFYNLPKKNFGFYLQKKLQKTGSDLSTMLPSHLQPIGSTEYSQEVSSTGYSLMQNTRRKSVVQNTHMKSVVQNTLQYRLFWSGRLSSAGYRGGQSSSVTTILTIWAHRFNGLFCTLP